MEEGCNCRRKRLEVKVVWRKAVIEGGRGLEEWLV
jgi:hypothetical protein